MQSKSKDLIAILILIIVIVIRFSPFIFLGKPLNTDSWKRIYPWRAAHSKQEIRAIDYDYSSEYDVWFPLAKEQLKNGEFPNWNPYSFCGAPLYANHFIPLFHVPFALSLLWSGHFIGSVYAFLMAITGTLFFYWFCRNWKFSVLISLFGGLVFFLSGWLMYLAPSEVASSIWVPAILLFHDRFLESNRISDAFWGAFCIAQWFIAGYPIFLVQFMYFMVVYVIWRRFCGDFKWKMPVSRWVSALLIMFIVGVLLSAVQNAPTYQFKNISNRSFAAARNSYKSVSEVIERESNLKTSLARKAMILNPAYYFDFISRNYAGPVVILLALIALFAAPRRWRTLKILFLIFAVIAIFSPIYPVLAKVIPGWSISLLPPRPVFFFILYFMAVVGLDHLLNLQKRSIRIIILAVLVTGVSYALTYLPRAQSFTLEPDIYRWSQPIDSTARWVCLILSYMAIVLIIMRASGRNIRQYMGAAVITLFTVSGLIAQFYIFPYFSDKDPMPLNSEMKAIVDTCSDGRITRYSTKNPIITDIEIQDYLLLPNLPAGFRMFDTLGYDSLMLADYERFFNSAAPGNISVGRGMFCVKDIRSLNPDGFLMQATGTKYILGFDEPDLDNLFGKPVYNNALQIYKAASVGYPFAKFVVSYELESEYTGDVRTDNFVNRILLNKKPVLPDGSILESNFAVPVNGDSIKIKRSFNTIEISFNAPQNCILYIPDAFHKDWRAKLDGKNIEILKANMAFRAVAVPSGAHTLTMWFDGRDVLIGGTVSAVTLVLSLLVLLVGRRKKV